MLLPIHTTANHIYYITPIGVRSKLVVVDRTGIIVEAFHLPYEIVKSRWYGSPSKPYVVRKKDSHEIIGRHATREKAIKQIQAIEIHENEE